MASLAWRSFCVLVNNYRGFSVAQVHMDFLFPLEKPPERPLNLRTSGVGHVPLCPPSRVAWGHLALWLNLGLCAGRSWSPSD